MRLLFMSDLFIHFNNQANPPKLSDLLWYMSVVQL